MKKIKMMMAAALAVRWLPMMNIAVLLPRTVTVW